MLEINKNTIVGKSYEEFKKSYSSESENIYQYLILGEVGFKESNSFEDSLSFSVSEKETALKSLKEKKFTERTISFYKVNTGMEQMDIFMD